MIDDREWNRVTTEQKLDLLKREITSIVPTLQAMNQNLHSRFDGIVRGIGDLMDKIESLSKKPGTS